MTRPHSEVHQGYLSPCPKLGLRRFRCQSIAVAFLHPFFAILHLTVVVDGAGTLVVTRASRPLYFDISRLEESADGVGILVGTRASRLLSFAISRLEASVDGTGILVVTHMGGDGWNRLGFPVCLL